MKLSVPQFLPFECKAVKISEINVRGIGRRPLNEPWSKKLAAALVAGKVFTPVRLNRRPDDTLWVLDGLQRIEAVRLVGGTVVSAEIYEVPEFEEGKFTVLWNEKSLTQIYMARKRTISERRNAGTRKGQRYAARVRYVWTGKVKRRPRALQMIRYENAFLDTVVVPGVDGG